MLSQTEVKQLFASIRNLKYRALLITAYAGGLRTSEVVRLRLTDIDSERMVIRIHQGKGRKDRYIMLAPTLLKVLRQYWQRERPATWLFPGQDGKHPITAHRVAEMCRRFGIEAGVKKPRRLVWESLVLPQLRDAGIDVNELERRFVLQENQANEYAYRLAVQIKESQEPSK